MENTDALVMGQPMAIRKKRHLNLIRTSPAAEKVFRIIALTLLVGNTLSILICIDLLVFGRMNLTLLLFIFVGTLLVNVKLFRMKGYRLGLGGL